jgi:hypothetical protein
MLQEFKIQAHCAVTASSSAMKLGLFIVWIFQKIAASLVKFVFSTFSQNWKIQIITQILAE